MRILYTLPEQRVSTKRLNLFLQRVRTNFFLLYSVSHFRLAFYKLLKVLGIVSFSGTFENVPCFTSTIGNLKHRAAIALPGIGIFIHPQDAKNTALIRHEFGHILQAKKWGKFFFYGTIAWVSLMSARKASRNSNYDHQETWTEWSANKLAYDYFNRPSDWSSTRYPWAPPIVKRKLSELPTKVSMQ